MGWGEAASGEVAPIKRPNNHLPIFPSVSSLNVMSLSRTAILSMAPTADLREIPLKHESVATITFPWMAIPLPDSQVIPLPELAIQRLLATSARLIGWGLISFVERSLPFR